MRFATVILLLIIGAGTCLAGPKHRRYYIEPHAPEVQWAKQVCRQYGHRKLDNAPYKPTDMCNWAHWLANMSPEEFWKIMSKVGYAGG